MSVAGARKMSAIARNLHKVSVIPIPMNLGQPSLGLDQAPKMMLDAGLVKLLGSAGWKWKQLPDIYKDPSLHRDIGRDYEKEMNARNCLQVGKITEMIRDQVKGEVLPDTFPLILGGDQCVSIGAISAIKECRPDTAVVYVDAHGDLNTPETTVTNNMHGMSAAFLLGLIDKVNELPGFSWFKPCLAPKDIVYIGTRVLQKGEKAAMKKLGIKAFTMYDIDRHGIGHVMDQALDYIGDRPIHMSFDIGAIDPFFAPHTGSAVTGGLTFREANFVCEALYGSGRLSSMEIVEVDPTIHKDKGVDAAQTIDVAMTLIGSAMGQRII